MARFDVFNNPNGRGYLLDVQSDLLEDLNTRVVVPLLPKPEAPNPAKTLNPTFSVNRGEVVMATQYLAAVPARELKVPIANLGDLSHEISTAVDMLFIGF